MNWKIFTTAFGSALLLALPQNSFTCGPSEDPYDYYTSFFSNRLGTDKSYKPFYYTGLLNFYDEWNPDSTAYENDKVLREWMDYGKTTRLQDAADLVYKSSAEEMAQLAKSLTAGGPLPAAFKANSLAQNFVKEKKTAAVQYLQLAKKTEALSPRSEWEEAPKRDSLQLNKLLAETEALQARATDPFFKNKYAFQACKVAFYNHRYARCLQLCEANFPESNPSALTPLAQSYAGGSLYRTGKKKEAAYVFSKLFMQPLPGKKSAYLGFWWASNNADAALIPAYTAQCKNNTEKAAMLGMFALYGTAYKLAEMQQVYTLNPASPLLPLLATREINKLEEQYFTPLLNKEKGGKALYVSWMWREEEAAKAQNGKEQATKTAAFFEKLSADASVGNRSLYNLSAAYLRFMNKDYEGAKTLLAKAGTQADKSLKEQSQLIALLIAANEAQAVTKEREAQLLPSLKWLVQKAKTDGDYRAFCRNFFSEILAQKYEQQGDAARAALAYGMADLAYVSDGENDYYSFQPAVNFVREDMTTDALLKLYNLTAAPQTETEKFFVQYGSVKRDAVADVLGTSYLRDRAYAKAIEWFGKTGKPQPLVEVEYNYQTGKEKNVNVDPLFDYLNDWQRYSKPAAAPYTKLSLAKKLLELQTKVNGLTAAGDDASKLYYQYASALYNLSHYGNSWSAVAYDRSGVDWNEGKYDLPWQKEYFGVYEARSFYQKAYDAAVNKEFKAACLFMVIKCAQRQVPRPVYDYKAEAASEKAAAAFDKQFRQNPLFQKFKTEFGATKFYQYAYNRCSYLRDYVKKR